MVAKFLDDNKRKIHLKSKFALFQTSSILFNFVYFVKFWQNIVDLIRIHLSLEKEKETFCVVFIYSAKRGREIRKFHVAKRNVQKKRRCFANLNLSVFFFFLPFSLVSPSSLLNLDPIAVIQKFDYHGNLTSHLSSPFLGQ